MRTLLISMVLMLAGCTQVIVESDEIKIKVNTFMKDIDFDEINVPSIFNLKMYRGESKDVTVITPGGAISTKGGN